MKNSLANLLSELEVYLSNYDVMNLQVSQATIGWHIEHSLLTINNIIGAVQKSNPQDYKWEFSFFKILILASKKIPRGKAKAPTNVVPKEGINKDNLQLYLNRTIETIKELEVVFKDHFFEHPHFGKLKLKETVRFLEIHTQHHLDIIHDIIQNKSN